MKKKTKVLLWSVLTAGVVVIAGVWYVIPRTLYLYDAAGLTGVADAQALESVQICDGGSGAVTTVTDPAALQELLNQVQEPAYRRQPEWEPLSQGTALTLRFKTEQGDQFSFSDGGNGGLTVDNIRYRYNEWPVGLSAQILQRYLNHADVFTFDSVTQVPSALTIDNITLSMDGQTVNITDSKALKELQALLSATPYHKTDTPADVANARFSIRIQTNLNTVYLYTDGEQPTLQLIEDGGRTIDGAQIYAQQTAFTDQQLKTLSEYLLS